MGSEMVLVKQLLLVVWCVLLQKVLDSLLWTVAAHVFHQISVHFLLLFFFLCISHKDPRQHWILCNIKKIPSCHIVEPLNVLEVAHLFVYPLERLLRLQVRRIGIFFNGNMFFQNSDKLINIFQIKVQQVNLSRFQSNLQSIHLLVESSFTNEKNFPEMESKMQKVTICKGLYAHMIELFCVVFWRYCHKSLLRNPCWGHYCCE